ncbi:unnamed protein product [Ilex paraguariensis]|uniref:Uncharacterized protein n=1 Tax=Ilex paraguariensis TaxID=185542 RepID=A0ABC8TPQ0_9AQUA
METLKVSCSLEMRSDMSGIDETNSKIEDSGPKQGRIGSKVEKNSSDPSCQGHANKHGVCETCHGSFWDFSGHYGNLTFLSQFIMLDKLKCISKSCFRVLLDEKEHVDLLKKIRNARIAPLKKSELAKRIVKWCPAMTSSKSQVFQMQVFVMLFLP